MLVAGIDAGTQSIKVLVYDSDEKKTVALSQCPLSLISEKGGVREQKAQWYIEALEKCFSSIEDTIKKRIKAISVSGQQHGFVPLDERGNVLWNIKLWCDTSTQKECSEIEEKAGGRERVIEMAGNPILPGYTASKILWLKKNHRDIYGKMKWVLLPHDYINYYLTGEIVMERGDASGTGLLNIRTGEWERELCSIISSNLIDKLPQILPFPSIIGKVRKEIVGSLGLGEEVFVASGGGDNMMSAIGTGAVRDGEVTISLGTSGTLFASSSYPIIDPKARLAAFSSSHSTYLPLLCTMNCTVAGEVLRKEMGLSVEEFVAEAEKAEIGSEGLVLLPFFNGERIPDYPKGEGVLGGMNMNNVKRENICRSALEGVSFEFLLGLRAFKELGVKPKVASLTGGGSKSRFWREMLSDITGLEIRCPQNTEAAAFGAALQALSLVENKSVEECVEEHLLYDEEKSVKPNFERHEKYMKAYEKWSMYSCSMKSIFK